MPERTGGAYATAVGLAVDDGDRVRDGVAGNSRPREQITSDAQEIAVVCFSLRDEHDAGCRRSWANSGSVQFIADVFGYYTWS